MYAIIPPCKDACGKLAKFVICAALFLNKSE